MKHDIRGLGFKFKDFLNKSLDACHTELKCYQSENIFFDQSHKTLKIVLLKGTSRQ